MTKHHVVTMTLNFYQVGLEMNDGTGPVRLSVTPPESLCDGKFHMITGTT